MLKSFDKWSEQFAQGLNKSSGLESVSTLEIMKWLTDLPKPIYKIKRASSIVWLSNFFVRWLNRFM